MICKSCGMKEGDILVCVGEKTFNVCPSCAKRDEATLRIIGREDTSVCMICGSKPDKQSICKCKVDDRVADFEANFTRISRNWRSGLLTFGEYQYQVLKLIGGTVARNI